MATVLAPSGAKNSTASTSGANLRTGAQTLSTRLLRCSVEDIARSIDKDTSTASRVRAGERAVTVAEFCELLELVGLKLVPVEKQCVPADELKMLRRCYAAHHNVDLWEEAE